MLEIYVEEERVYGNTSCNTIDGKVVKIDEKQYCFSDIITTEMACPGRSGTKISFCPWIGQTIIKLKR